MDKIKFSTSRRCEIVDITDRVQDCVKRSGVDSGIILVYSPHTTGGISVNENADSDVKRDMNEFLSDLVPQKSSFHHCEGNSDAHIKGSLVNFSQMFIVENGRVALGTWQGIYFMEFDGPRLREVWVKVQ